MADKLGGVNAGKEIRVIKCELLSQSGGVNLKEGAPHWAGGLKLVARLGLKQLTLKHHYSE